MTTVQLSIVCLTVLLIVLAVATRHPGAAAAHVFTGLTVGHQVAVHMGDGQSVRGTILRCENGCLVLTGAAILSGGKEAALGGTTRVSGEGVALIQEI